MTAKTVYQRALKRAGDAIRFAEQHEALDGEQEWLKVAEVATRIVVMLEPLVREEEKRRHLEMLG